MKIYLFVLLYLGVLQANALIQVIEFDSMCSKHKVVQIDSLKYRDSATYESSGIYAIESSQKHHLKINTSTEACQITTKQYIFDDSYILLTPKTLLRDFKGNGCRFIDQLHFFLFRPTVVYFGGSHTIQINDKLFNNGLKKKMHQITLQQGVHFVSLNICGQAKPSLGDGYQDMRWLGVWYKNTTDNENTIIYFNNKIQLVDQLITTNSQPVFQ